MDVSRKNTDVSRVVFHLLTVPSLPLQLDFPAACFKLAKYINNGRVGGLVFLIINGLIQLPTSCHRKLIGKILNTISKILPPRRSAERHSAA